MTIFRNATAVGGEFPLNPNGHNPRGGLSKHGKHLVQQHQQTRSSELSPPCWPFRQGQRRFAILEQIRGDPAKAYYSIGSTVAASATATTAQP